MKFKHPEDAQVLFETLMLLGYGIAYQLETNNDFDSAMSRLRNILDALKRNFYKEAYLQ